MFSCLSKIFGNFNTRVIKQYEKIVEEINNFEPSISQLSDEELAGKTFEFKRKLEDGKTLDDILPEAFAVVREASKRVLGMRHFDVQMIGGIALHKGQIAEMKTGEGKTLVATLAAYLNALSGKGVHVVTVNDYLAKRDAEWMGKIYKFLNLSVGIIISGMPDELKKEAYDADITYGTNHEFGFDYLRDNLKFQESDMVMRDFNFAIVDEVDSILIDEARTPLIISGADDNASRLYVAVDAIVRNVTKEDYDLDEKQRVVTLTESGVEKMEKALGEAGLLDSPVLYDSSNISIVYHMNCALRAHTLFKKDVDYMVRDGEVLIIDEFTGRIMDGRRYSEGLHQAIEAKEGVEVQTESITVATISYQNLFRLYPKLSGMTGTAMTEEAEFDEIYKLKVVSIPSNLPVVRKDLEDSMFVTLEEKDRAVLNLIKECYARKQPVLVGTTSLERSEHFSELLQRENIPHNVLNAKQHEREAYIVAEAGAPGAVTIATNMAGRGTDIKLGGSPELRIEQECAGIEDPIERQAKIDKIKNEVKEAYDEVSKAGGLFVIGTERNDSRRIDNQLRGRSGRQGDPGASKYFLSLEDDLMRKFGSPNLIARFRKVCKNDEELSFRWISKAIEKAQQRVEAFNFDIRKQLLRFDDVMNDQRKMIYDMRKVLMRSNDVSEQIKDMIDDILDSAVINAAPQDSVPLDWKLDDLSMFMKRTFAIDLDIESIVNDSVMTRELLRQKLGELVESRFKEKIEEVGEDIMRRVEKEASLKTIDISWRQHLVVLEHLRRGINLRAYAQKNPLNEYKFEAFNIFEDMVYRSKVKILEAVFNFEVRVEPSMKQRIEEILARIKGLKENPSENKGEHTIEDLEKAEAQAMQIAEMLRNEENQSESEEEVQNVQKQRQMRQGGASDQKPSRNAICPCGSGKRYKHCCGSISQYTEVDEEETK